MDGSFVLQIKTKEPSLLLLEILTLILIETF